MPQYTAIFNRAWERYPRDANDSKSEAFGAWNARVREGVPEADMLAGTERYAAHVAATGRIPKNGRTFFGPYRHWEAAWEVPAPRPVPSALANDRARLILDLATRYNLLSHTANDREYAERLERAGSDPGAWPTFAADVRPLRLTEGIGNKQERFAVEEIARRLASPGARAAA